VTMRRFLLPILMLPSLLLLMAAPRAVGATAPVAAVPPTDVQAAPALREPADGAVTPLSIPHFRWQPTRTPTPEAMGSYDIQVGADGEFAHVVDEDRIAAVICRYVPDRELAPGAYWWRVAGVDAGGTRGPWSEARRFSVRPPGQVFAVRRDAGFADIQAVLTQAAARAPALVRFEEGNYRLDPGGASAFISLANATDLVIDGVGANMTFTGFLTFVKLQHCRRVQVKNFTFDFDPLPYTAGRVLAANLETGTFDVEMVPGHPLPESNPHFARDTRGMIVDPRYPRMKRGVRLVLEHSGWRELAERRYRFTAANRSQVRELAPGDIYVLDPRIATGFDVDASDEVVFCGLTAYAVANEAFNSHYGNRLSILHCGIRLKPGRFLAANNGGHNHHNARLGPWIEGGTWENTGDDICHVNCLVMGVEEQRTPNSVRLPLRNPYDIVGASVALDIRPGDLLQFFNRAAGRLLAERSVVSTTKGERFLDVALSGTVDSIVPGRPGVRRVGIKKVPSDGTVTQLFDAGRTCNQFVFRNNTVRNGRRIGVLAKGCGGLIENNTFEGLGGGAVEFWNAPFEGLGAADYVVRGNRIRDCGLLAREHAAVWATIFRTGGDRLHRRLLIADNEIDGFPAPAILLRDVDNAVVRDNRIRLASPLARHPVSADPIMLSNTAAVRLEHNAIQGPSP